jgi:hypothetical protein
MQAGDTSAVMRGAEWLRKGQNSDGGWGQGHLDGKSHPAYTAHAVHALLHAGIPPASIELSMAGEYLESQFRSDQPEPWRATSSNFVIDDSSGARLDYRHFTTPWVIGALTRLGRNIGDSIIIQSVEDLLDLQKPDGTWGCSQTAPDVSAVWALYDALNALRTVMDSSLREVPTIAATRLRDGERIVMQRAIVDLLRTRAIGGTIKVRAIRFQGIWLSVLTVGFVLLVAAQLGWLNGLTASSPLGKAASAVLASIIAIVAAFGPPLLAQEYRFRRDHRQEAKAKKGNGR